VEVRYFKGKASHQLHLVMELLRVVSHEELGTVRDILQHNVKSRCDDANKLIGAANGSSR
jgi:hypothetical protein